MESTGSEKVMRILHKLELSEIAGTLEREGLLDLGAFLLSSEDKLEKAGVPLGPSLIIAQEIQRLKKKVPSHKHTFLTPVCDFCAPRSVAKPWLQSLKEEKFEEVFELVVPLHENPTANVWVARWKREEKYAIAKIIKKHAGGEKAARQEVNCLNLLQGCKYVVELLKVWERPHDFVLLFPVHKAYLPFGLSASDLQRYMHSMINALHEIHSKGIVHGDISMGNILYDKVKGRLLLIDFGSAAQVGVNWQRPAPYSVDYVAPERREMNGVYHPLSDVYSAGQLFRHLKKKSNWGEHAEDLYNLMGAPKLLCRITTERALLHPYFESINSSVVATVPNLGGSGGSLSRPTSPVPFHDDQLQGFERKRKRD